MRLTLPMASLGLAFFISPACAQATNSTGAESFSLVAWIPAFGGAATLIVCGIVFFYTRHLSQVKTTIELHSEFHSESFTKSRIAASDTLEKYLQDRCLAAIDIEDLRNYCALEAKEAWLHISRVLHFFERLSILQRHRLVSNRASAALFDRYIEYWREHYFTKFEPDGRWKALVEALIADKPKARIDTSAAFAILFILVGTTEHFALYHQGLAK